MATLAPPTHPHVHTSHHRSSQPHPPTPPHSSPSSPSSTHSSSSAIFERDIEPLSLAPAPRDHALSSLVPSVLDEAVEVLTDQHEGGPDVEVEMVGNMTSPPASDSMSEGALSRSPSPPASQSSPDQPTRPLLPERQSTLPFVPGGFPATPASLPPSPPQHLMEIPGISNTATSPTPLVTARTPGPHASPSKRLSFVSYSDLLLSSPVTSVPLSQVTSPPHPPPHLPQLAPPTTLTPLARSREASTYGDEGGEWGREGLGRGLEERLEVVLRKESDESKA